METKRTATALVLLLGVVFFFWLIASYGNFPQLKQSVIAGTQNGIEENTGEDSRIVMVHHAVKNGVHTYTGSVSLSECNTLATGVATKGTNPTHVSLTLISVPSSDCPARGNATTSESFSVSVGMQKNTAAPVFDTISLNGSTVAFSVIEDN